MMSNDTEVESGQSDKSGKNAEEVYFRDQITNSHHNNGVGEVHSRLVILINIGGERTKYIHKTSFRYFQTTEIAQSIKVLTNAHDRSKTKFDEYRFVYTKP